MRQTLLFTTDIGIFCQLKRLLNVYMFAKLKRSIQIIDNFVMHLIHKKREQLKNEHDCKKLHLSIPYYSLIS